MSRYAVAAILVALSACEYGSAERLFTKAEVAALEKRVLDKVAETDQSCIRPELVALMKPDGACANEANRQRLGYTKRPAVSLTPSLQRCADRLAGEIKAIAAAGVGCSPFQVGVHSGDWNSKGHGVWPFHIANLLSLRAETADDTAVALNEILDAVHVSQDVTRGRVPVLNAIATATMEDKLLATANKLVTKQSLSEDQLAALIEKVDSLIQTEPDVVENLRGEAVYTALHLGVVAIEGPFWKPPGGRSDVFLPHLYQVDFQEDVGASFISALLWNEEQVTRFCKDDNLALCFFSLNAPLSTEATDIAAEVQGAGILLALEPSEEARMRLQRRVVAKSKDSLGVYEIPVQQRGRILSRLAALRMQLDALRSHECPTLEANAVGTYYLRGRPEPRNLGGPLQLMPVDGGIDVLPPVWVAMQKPIAHISCP